MKTAHQHNIWLCWRGSWVFIHFTVEFAILNVLWRCLSSLPQNAFCVLEQERKDHNASALWQQEYSLLDSTLYSCGIKNINLYIFFFQNCITLKSKLVECFHIPTKDSSNKSNSNTRRKMVLSQIRKIAASITFFDKKLHHLFYSEIHSLCISHL